MFCAAGWSLCTSNLRESIRFQGIALNLDIFEAPVTVTPQQKISKTLNSSKIP